MGIVNTIAEFAKAQGCRNAYEFWKVTGLSQATAYRLYNNPTAFPSKETQEAICRAFNAQPGEFLRYAANGDES
jgi:DNA-binding Xre family transcriptional regulator